MIDRAAAVLTLVVLWMAVPAWAAECKGEGVHLQVLGSGGPELDDGRASSGYLVWQDGRARVLIDLGGGSLQRYEQSGAALNDLDLILLTHLHVDHSADLPQLLKASYFSGRDRDLPVYGPSGNALMPAMDDYLQQLFGPHGAYRYLADYLDGRESYRLLAHSVDAEATTPQRVYTDQRYRVSAIGVDHGPVPALAWRVELGGRSMVVSGDMTNTRQTLAKLAQGADLLIAHHAIPEDAGAGARRLHMPPSEIGRIAAAAGVKQLVLSHRMNRTYGREAESERLVRAHYAGPLRWAEDLQCVD